MNGTIKNLNFKTTKVNWIPVYIDDEGNAVIFKPVLQADGTYLLIGKRSVEDQAEYAPVSERLEDGSLCRFYSDREQTYVSVDKSVIKVSEEGVTLDSGKIVLE